MTKLLRIPNEARFVRAFALVIDPGNTLSLLLEIGALGSKDLSIVRHTREALDPAYDRASDLKDRDQTHTISVVREALAQSDSAAYLAYCVRDSQHPPKQPLAFRRRLWSGDVQCRSSGNGPCRSSGNVLQWAMREAGPCNLTS